MRGQKLFVRPVESEDRQAISEFVAAHGDPATLRPTDSHVSACALLGKLVGDLVAVVEIHLTADAIQIDNVLVARELRRKRIGRVMLDEVERLAAKLDRHRLIVSEPSGAHEFFQRTGFEREGARWIRYVRSQDGERASR